MKFLRLFFKKAISSLYKVRMRNIPAIDKERKINEFLRKVPQNATTETMKVPA